MSAETVDQFELLCLTAKKRGWRVLLHFDGRKPVGSVEPVPSRLTLLELRDKGEMLARITVRAEDRLSDCAQAMLSQLVKAGYIRLEVSG